jgi:hypothetical protein
MSNINTASIDETKPEQGSATTASVRANTAAIKAQLGTAKTELRNLSGVTDHPAARTNLGLGTIATQDAAAVAVTGGSITGITDLAVADGGTGASTAADARANLGLGTLATQDDPATANTYLRRNAGNTAYEAKTAAAVLADLQAARHDDLYADWVVSGLLPATSATLTSDISAGQAYVTGRRIEMLATSHTYSASVDTYVDLDSTGTYLFSEVANGAAAPAQPADSNRLAKVVTSATAITSVMDLRNTTVRFSAAVDHYTKAEIGAWGLGKTNLTDWAGDLNTLYETGFYLASSAATNQPTGAGVWFVIVMTNDSNTSAQLAYRQNSTEAYIRHANAGVWSPWVATVHALHAAAAKAWVNFNGTGTVAIRDSYNVSSITDNGTGDYTVNFATAFASANYAVVGSGKIDSGDVNIDVPEVGLRRSASNPTTGAARITTGNNDTTALDCEIVNVVCFGDQ